MEYFSIFLISLYLINQSITGLGADYSAFYMAAQRIVSNEPIYNIVLALKPDNTLGYPYCPTFAFLLTPIVFLPYFVSIFIWLAFNTYLVYCLVYKINQFVFKDKNQFSILLCFTLILSSRLLLNVFEHGQVNILVVFCSVVGVLMIHEGRDIKGSILLGFGILLKFLPLVFLPYLIYRGRFKAFGYTLIAICILILLPATMIGWDQNIIYYREWFDMINPISGNFIKINQNSNGMTHFGVEEFIKKYHLVITDFYAIELLSIEKLKLIIMFFRTLVVLATFYFFRTNIFKPAMNNLHILWEVSYLILAASLIFPVQHAYSFVAVIPMCYYISNALYNEKIGYKKWVYVGLFIYLSLTLFCSDLFIGSTLKKITMDYKSITLGVVVLMIVHGYLKPKSKESNL